MQRAHTHQNGLTATENLSIRSIRQVPNRTTIFLHLPSPLKLTHKTALKAQTDDTIPTLLTALRAPYTLTPSHTHTHIRLALGYSAVLIAATLFVADYRLGWAATKPWTLPACLAYFALNAALTTWIWFGEKGKVFVGKREGGQVVSFLCLLSYLSRMHARTGISRKLTRGVWLLCYS